MIRVLIVDDHDLVRTGLRHIIDRAEDVDVVAEAGSGDEALRRHRELTPDVVLMDISMPGMSGLEVTQRMLRSDDSTRIIILTAHAQSPFPTRLLEAGAMGYLTKACAADELLSAIRSVNEGRRYIGSEIAQQLALALLPGTEQSPFEELSSREMEVTLMLTQGLNVADIAQTMSLSPKTVSTYKYRIYEKLQIKNEVELTRLAMRHGLIEGDN
ncbi:MAG: UvrY/SirA/GacA family response regulator transcription factor [Wenzhouxiangellaceae bacterium]